MRNECHLSIHAALRSAEETPRVHNPEQRGKVPSSEEGGGFRGGLPFREFVDAVRNSPATFSSEMALILTVASEILGELPTKNAKTRKRVPARKGGRPSATALLSGNYSRAFNSWGIKWTHKPPTHVAIFVPTVFSAYVSRTEIGYCVGAPIALGLFLEQEFGISVDLWGASGLSGSWSTGDPDAFFVVRLKAPNAPIILEDIACVAHPAWLRS